MSTTIIDLTLTLYHGMRGAAVTFIALPLKVQAGDGSPVCAIGMIDSTDGSAE